MELRIVRRIPLGKGSFSFLKFERVKAYVGRKAAFDFGGKVQDHVLAGGLIGHQNNVMAATFKLLGEFDVRCIGVENRGVVKYVDDVFLDDSLEIGKINHHPKFDVARVGDGRSDYGNRKFVAVSVNVATFSVITIKRMAGLESELLGNPDLLHGVRLWRKGINSCLKNSFGIWWVKVLAYICPRYGDVAQLARALAWHARGRGFDSHLLHKAPFNDGAFFMPKKNPGLAGTSFFYY